MRPLHLTSPLMHGSDVRSFQASLNARLRHYGRTPIPEDNQFGAQTLDEARRVAWWLGVGERHLSGVVTAYVQRLIAHPGLRNPVQLARAKQRRPKAPSGVHAVIAWERSKVGVHEIPASSNWGGEVQTWLKFWGLGPAPWCGAFAGYALRNHGHVPVTARVVYVPYIIEDAKAGRNGFSGWHSWTDRVPGDLVCCNFSGGSLGEHVETYIGNAEDIGGNTSSDEAGSQSNGGIVAYKHRPPSVILGCARPRW